MSQAQASVPELDFELTGAQRLPIRASEAANVYAEPTAGGMANIEVPGILAVRTMGEHVIPPRVQLGGRHVVRHNIQKNADRLRARRVHKMRPGFIPAQITADMPGINDIVAVRASRGRLQAR